jgi:hypothetical protein
MFRKVDTALLVAILSGVVALASAAVSRSTQLKLTRLTAEREKEAKAEERRSAAKVVLDRCRGPLLDAAWQLGDVIDNIRHRDFLAYLSPGGGREQDAKFTTLFRLARYLGWREYVRTEVQLLRFEKERDTRLVAGFLDDVSWVLASDRLDGEWAMLWGDEQRAIGELMTEHPSAASSIVRGHASFRRGYDETFAPWMERLAADLLTPAAVTSDRLRVLQWALWGLVSRLDEERAYSTAGWMARSADEVGRAASRERMSNAERRVREHLAAITSD